ncbi:hypothetical protein CKO38_09340 [Rhodospirillum rubrum]|uniref:DUF134 domain-containing protein n=1 Tax=Rhodospirillum rubrum TaxID=1085 RepID=UPI001905F43C|nr:DUF134 domain-containing protein [Rhodospirillum rubrum]MBK1665344.1 hypothetical protein [Rhodospirillum rubrum]MBK1676872.1 hypothetical protein [Rhodospirillum rubrum]
MPRPRKTRTVRTDLAVHFYKPQGIPLRDLQSVTLSLDGLEALRLADVEGLEHAAGADSMDISRPTFSRLLTEARTTVATALVEGWAIHIDGGPVAQGPALDGSACPNRRQRRGPCARRGGAGAPRTDDAPPSSPTDNEKDD